MKKHPFTELDEIMYGRSYKSRAARERALDAYVEAQLLALKALQMALRRTWRRR